jgi:N-ethylmaleimide reductase
MKTLSADKLFTPIQVGPLKLKHRVVMSPLTRSRSVQPGSIPGDLMLEYYSQRASDGGLIVSEGTFPLCNGRRMPQEVCSLKMGS